MGCAIELEKWRRFQEVSGVTALANDNPGRPPLMVLVGWKKLTAWKAYLCLFTQKCPELICNFWSEVGIHGLNILDKWPCIFFEDKLIYLMPSGRQAAFQRWSRQDQTGKEKTVPAKTHSADLFSRRLVPTGCGNSSEQVGRFLCSRPRTAWTKRW